jgi:DMSO/TMAO reductase YedYZ molybdopterin-dependent catalytic subunit
MTIPTPQDKQVPKLNWESHKIKVTGLVDAPKEYTPDELVNSFKAVTSKTTLRCTGVLHHPDLTGEWRGVRLSDILEDVGVQKDRAKTIKFNGADDVHYFTKVPIGSAHDVLLAYELNGKQMLPEHGFPVRVVVGESASKAVKWVQLIEVTDEEAN